MLTSKQFRKFKSSDFKIGQIYFFQNALKAEGDLFSRIILTLPDSLGSLSAYCFTSNRICEFNLGSNLASFRSCFVYR